MALMPPRGTRSFRKYVTHGVLDWQDTLAYRANAIAWGLVDGLPAITMALVWLSVFHNRKEVGGYTLPQMITYYMVALAASMLTTPHPEYDMSDSIRSGRLTPQLVQPIDRWLVRCIGETMWQGGKFVMFLPTLVLTGWLLRAYLELPGFVGRLPAFALAIVLAYLANVGIKMAMGALAFWMADIGGVINIVECFWGLLSGEILPLALLPVWALRLAAWLPFKWVVWFPTELLLGRLSSSAVLHGLVAQALWAVGTVAFSRFLWLMGLRTYQAIGG